MVLKSLIIDDEPLAIEVIKNHLLQINDIQLVDTFSNAIDGLNFLKNNSVDIIFLDINMPLLDGLNFIKSLEKKPCIIITSAHSQFALESFELDVLDYLMKPIPFPRFLKAINKVFNLRKSQNSIENSTVEKPFLFVKIDKKKMKKIYLDDLLVVESLKDYLKITTTEGKYIIHHTLSNFTKRLPPKNFIRIHRSHTISIAKIDVIEGNSVEIGGLRYIIGRSYVDQVKSQILNT